MMFRSSDKPPQFWGETVIENTSSSILLLLAFLRSKYNSSAVDDTRLLPMFRGGRTFQGW
jgi:hypothetical protein